MPPREPPRAPPLGPARGHLFPEHVAGQLQVDRSQLHRVGAEMRMQHPQAIVTAAVQVGHPRLGIDKQVFAQRRQPPVGGELGAAVEGCGVRDKISTTSTGSRKTSGSRASAKLQLTTTSG